MRAPARLPEGVDLCIRRALSPFALLLPFAIIPFPTPPFFGSVSFSRFSLSRLSPIRTSSAIARASSHHRPRFLTHVYRLTRRRFSRLFACPGGSGRLVYSPRPPPIHMARGFPATTRLFRLLLLYSPTIHAGRRPTRHLTRRRRIHTAHIAKSGAICDSLGNPMKSGRRRRASPKYRPSLQKRHKTPRSLPKRAIASEFPRRPNYHIYT